MRTHRFCHPAWALLLGLLITQILATMHVHRSNLDLLRTVSLLQDAGYVVIPNALVAPTLKELGPAIWGGLFFTLSLGAGLSLFSFITAWSWDRLFHRKKSPLFFVLLLWLTLIFCVNARHISILVTLYFLIVPSVVFITTLKTLPPKEEINPWRRRVIPLAPIVLLTIVWALQADRFLFLDIRDFLLLSNPIGKKIDAFYYRYTLYPADVFKTLEQKTLKTCRVIGQMGPREKKRLEAVLIQYDYLPVRSASLHSPVDLDIEASTSKLVFRHGRNAILDIDTHTFLARPDEALRTFSKEIDSHALFRQATIWGLLTGYPILLYVLVFSLCQIAAGFVVGPKRSIPAAAALTFLFGLALLEPLVVGRTGKLENAQLPAALQSESWKQRVCALRTIVEDKQNISTITDYNRFVTSSHVAERYWIAKALGLTPTPQAYKTLLTLLNDDHPDVVSMAFYSLGQQQDQRAVPEILRRLQTSDHWYNQWYAYRALRSLGWKQKTGS